MATYLSNYLSAPGSRNMNTTGKNSFPVIRQINPYNPQNLGSRSAAQTPAPYAGQDLASTLLAQRTIAQQQTPSNVFTDTYNYDPIQQQIAAIGNQSVADAQNNSAQLRKQAAINEGDPDLLRALGYDTDTITAAQNNPQSLLAQLNTDYNQRKQQLADAMQAQNLYYSGEYQKQLTDLATGQATAQSNLGEKLRSLLSGADAGVLQAQEADRQNQLQAQLQAQAQADAAAQAQQTADLYNSLLGQLAQGFSPGDTSPADTSGMQPPDQGPAAPAMPPQPAPDWIWDPGSYSWVPPTTIPQRGGAFYT